MKKFFQKLRMDAKFAKAGEGHRLTEDTRTYKPQDVTPHPYVRTRPMTSSQAQAGAAALARQEERSKQTKTVRPLVMGSKMRNQENQRSSTSSPPSNSVSEEEKQKTNASPVESSIMFHSPFTDEIIAKSELKHHMRENLIMRLQESPVEASSLMIQTLTSSQDKKANAVGTLNKYLDNMINNPNEEKYRKIRKNNKVFTEKVASVEGTEEFLEGIGFRKTLEEDEIFFVLESVDVAKLKEAKEILASAEAMEFRLYRDARILIPTGTGPPDFSLPDEFYKLTSSEVKREQEKRAENVELNKQLRTKAMREAGKVNYKCNYAILRVKFPDERLLQGTFRAAETINDLKDFIRQHINVEWAVFDLKTAFGEVLTDDDATLLTSKLVPAAVVNLVWNEEVRIQVLKEQGIHLALCTP